MTDKLIVFVACESREQAETIAESVVTSQLAACVNVIPGVRSCYMWEAKLTWSEEVVLLIKTTRSRYGQLQERVRQLHSYEIPEIVSVEIDEGFEKYIDWIEKSVVGHRETRKQGN
jgi:periplasmic divalent cation tolerance protein